MSVYDTRETGAEELRRTTALFNRCSETFNDRFDAAQLLDLWRAWAQCDWSFLPDQWAPIQVIGALVGDVPKWNDGEAAPAPHIPDAKLEVWGSLTDSFYSPTRELETECTLAEFIADNFDSVELCVDVYKLDVDTEIEVGGGAAPVTWIRRVA